MVKTSYIWIFGLLLGFVNPAIGASDPLFSSNDVLTVRIAAPLTQIIADDSDDTEYAALISFPTEANASTSVDIKLRGRGRYRRLHTTCRFPPLRLNFRTSTVANTTFHKQDKLKLVTHCRDGKRYQRSVLREFLTYRILNELSDYSFRVRLLHITYVDTDKENREIVRYGFVIEDQKRLAKRIDRPQLEVARTRYGNLDNDYTSLVTVFHFLIGNTDFSPILGPPDGTCCHNHALFGKDGEALHSIPYDFDQAGMIDAPYALPNPRFGLRDVKKRLYRGRCSNVDAIPETLAYFSEKQPRLTALITAPEWLDETTRKEMLAYIESFYAIIGNEKRVQRAMLDECVK